MLAPTQSENMYKTTPRGSSLCIPLVCTKYQVPLFAWQSENRKHLALRQVSLVSSIYHQLSSLPRGEKEEPRRSAATLAAAGK